MTGIHIKKGLQKEVLYKGLKASYINYCIYLGLFIFLFGLILSFILPTVYSLIITMIVFILMLSIMLFYSKTYGANGYIKKIADKKKPKQIRVSNKISTMLIWKKL